MPPNKNASVVLYLTYDGLLDPLGASQILPYLQKLSSKKYRIHIISFEKIDRYQDGGSCMHNYLSSFNITWKPCIFSKRFGVAGKMYDFWCLHFFAISFSLFKFVRIIHCRGLAPAQVGFLIKKIKKAKLLFDFRGLWADERIDKGGWDLSNLFDLMQYKYYKSVEQFVLRRSDHIVVLTYLAKKELIKLYKILPSKLTIIPCCADFSHFQVLSIEDKAKYRAHLHLPADAFVIGYLGSIGGMYMCKEYLELLDLAFQRDINCFGLILTPDIQLLESLLSSYPLEFRMRIIYRFASRKEVAHFLPAMDILTSFITSTYARRAASPTKLAEAWACGIPTISSIGVGDVTMNTRLLDAGAVIDPQDPKDLTYVLSNIPLLISKGGVSLRKRASTEFSLEIGSSRYISIYKSLY